MISGGLTRVSLKHEKGVLQENSMRRREPSGLRWLSVAPVQIGTNSAAQNNTNLSLTALQVRIQGGLLVSPLQVLQRQNPGVRCPDSSPEPLSSFRLSAELPGLRSEG